MTKCSRLQALFLIGLITTAFADDLPKFGKVSKELLQATAMPEAPNSNAVILFDRGDMRITDDFEVELERHIRIKILAEEGKNWGDVKLSYWHEDKIKSLKAHAISPKGKKTKVEKFYDEKAGEWHKKVFAIPGIEIGSAIEYKYKLITERLTYLDPWFFQNNIFTKLSQLSVIVPPGFSYHVFFANIPDIKPIIEERLAPPRRVLKKYTWKAENLSPITKEPYMRAIKDYLAQMHFQLLKYEDAYNQIKWIQTWPELVAKVRRSLKDYLNPDDTIRNKASELTTGKNSDKEKIKALYDYVSIEIETSERGYTHPETRPADVIKNAKGTGADKNILLVNLLTAAGFDANPFLISTRAHGRVAQSQPLVTQFNYVLAHVQSGSQFYVLDTRDKYCPFGMLPKSDLVETGLLIDSGQGRFVNIPKPDSQNKIKSTTTATLTEEGNLILQLKMVCTGYRGYNARMKIRDSSEDEYITQLLSERFGEVQIDSFSVLGLENIEEPLKVDINCTAQQFANVVNDMMYLTAPVIDGYESNPLEREDRYFPVEFLYNRKTDDTITLLFPEGFEVVETPETATHYQKGFGFVSSWSASDKMIILNRSFSRNRVFFPASEYKQLRQFYDRVIAADQSQIVLKRTSMTSNKP